MTNKTSLLLAGLLIMICCRPSFGATVAPNDTISIERAFLEMPLNQLDLLNRGTRQDMLIYMHADSIWNATNAMEGNSRLTRLEKDFLEVELTPVSSLQMKVLPTQKGGNLVCAVYSVNSQAGELAGDSQLLFYDSQMKPLDEKTVAKLFKHPEVKDFIAIPKGSITKMKELEEMVPFPTVVYTLSPDNNSLQGVLTVGEYMNLDDYNILKLFLRPGGITYTWTGKEFKLAKGGK